MAIKATLKCSVKASEIFDARRYLKIWTPLLGFILIIFFKSFKKWKNLHPRPQGFCLLSYQKVKNPMERVEKPAQCRICLSFKNFKNVRM